MRYLYGMFSACKQGAIGKERGVEIMSCLERCNCVTWLREQQAVEKMRVRSSYHKQNSEKIEYTSQHKKCKDKKVLMGNELP